MGQAKGVQGHSIAPRHRLHLRFRAPGGTASSSDGPKIFCVDYRTVIEVPMFQSHRYGWPVSGRDAPLEESAQHWLLEGMLSISSTKRSVSVRLAALRPKEEYGNVRIAATREWIALRASKVRPSRLSVPKNSTLKSTVRKP